jgi:endonuclease/exonuclease/phosphatase family metal-dependent hydrolase
MKTLLLLGPVFGLFWAIECTSGQTSEKCPESDTIATSAATFLVAGCHGAATVRVTTWNLEWFPNGSAKEASPEEQNRRITEAANTLRALHPDILLLQEVRDYDVCARLGEAIQPGVYHVAICSAFKEPFQSGFGRQQVAILAKSPAQAAWTEPWKSLDGVDPPRGFAFAWFKIGNGGIGIYSLHLKSNLIFRGNQEIETAKNVRKREVAIQQLLTHGDDVIGKAIPSIKGVVIGGDFNTNHDQELFAAERTLDLLIDGRYRSGFEGLPLSERITHPGSHGYPDATFDYLFGKNVKMAKPIITKAGASDHMPVTCDIELPPKPLAIRPLTSGNALSFAYSALPAEVVTEVAIITRLTRTTRIAAGASSHWMRKWCSQSANDQTEF